MFTVSWVLSRIQISRPHSTSATVAALELVRQMSTLYSPNLSSSHQYVYKGPLKPPSSSIRPPTLICIDSLTSFHYINQYLDNLPPPLPPSVSPIQPVPSSNAPPPQLSGTNDFFILLERLRRDANVNVFATKSTLSKKRNSDSMPNIWR